MIKIILAITVIASCLLSAVLGKFMIPFLLRLKVGQTVRNEGPESHLKKNGTPTMGGGIFLISYTVLCLVFLHRSRYILPILLLTLGFGLIGFADDFIKVVLKRSMGLKPWQKTIGQLVVSTLFAWYMVSFSGLSLSLRVPFTGGYLWGIGFLAIPLIYLVLLGTTNGTNFTDGLDGLASSVTVVVAMFFMAAAALLNGEYVTGMLSSFLDPGKMPHMEPEVSVAVMITSAAMIGSLLGFLFYNAHPASVFMGDTGSLALG
ncbi:MAG: phospho-N-acetylmuramoyl-pentapeptide-transferase, partial [Lachnospiraceae bacterium]|nr:phospho-N-acetylmuramoyl-pentapeptide-transferase [Lachnospiraceae bacterium]